MSSTLAIGAQLGLWTIVAGPARKPQPSGGTRPIWMCRCHCGTERTVLQGDLASGRSTGCGCVGNRRIAILNRRHGETTGRVETPEYRTWKAMHDRCRATTGKGAARYRLRGISICERWHLFENFLEDMGRKPEGQYSLDRRDNDGNYEPKNCRWATKGEQARNTSRTHFVEAYGERLCITDWAVRLSIPRRELTSKLARGRSLESLLERIPAARLGA